MTLVARRPGTSAEMRNSPVGLTGGLLPKV